LFCISLNQISSKNYAACDVAVGVEAVLWLAEAFFPHPSSENDGRVVV
jgi:hypothetical protein